MEPQYLLIALAIVVGLPLLFLLVVAVMKRLYLRQRFTKPGFAFHHLGIKGENPRQRIFDIISNDRPSYVMRIDDWRYIGCSTIPELECVAGIDPDGNLEYLGAAYKPSNAVRGRITGKFPKADEDHAGYFVVALEEDCCRTVNFHCPFYRAYHYASLPADFDLSLSLFPSLVRVFEDQVTLEHYRFQMGRNPAAAVTGVSAGLYNLWEMTERPTTAPPNVVYVCGEVKGVRKRRSSISGKRYYVTSIKIGSAILDMVCQRRAFWSLPKKGEYIAVMGQLIGYLSSWNNRN